MYVFNRFLKLTTEEMFLMVCGRPSQTVGLATKKARDNNNNNNNNEFL